MTATLHVVYGIVLGLHVTAHGELVLGTVQAHLCPDVVVHVVIGGIAHLQGIIDDVGRVVVPVIVAEVDAVLAEGRMQPGAVLEVIVVKDGTDVAAVVRETVVDAVAQLQVSLVGDGFRVAELCREVVVLRGVAVELNLVIDRVIDEDAQFVGNALQVVRLAVALVLAGILAVTAVQVERHVAPLLAQPLVDLQRATGTEAVALTATVTAAVVDAYVVVRVQLLPVCQRVGTELIGIIIELCTVGIVLVAAFRPRHLGTEEDVPGTVGPPLRAVLEVETAVVVAAPVVVVIILGTGEFEVLAVAP